MKHSFFGAAATLIAMAIFAHPAFAISGDDPVSDPSALGCPSGAGDGVFNVTFSAVSQGQGTQPFNKLGQWTCDNSPAPPNLSPLNSPFNIFCVDFTGLIHQSDFYDAFATNVSVAGFASGGSHTEQGTLGERTYFEAVWLINNYFATGGTFTGNSVDYQFAVWAITDHSDSPSACVARFGSGCNGNVQSLITQAETGQGATDFASNPDRFSDWVIVTDIGCGGSGGSGGASVCPQQELVYNLGLSGPQENVVPEPGSMSLLALGLTGLAGAGLTGRKRRRNSAG